ncbi:gamma-glutamyltransferase [Thermodesulfobacteriota bacterium]
MAKAMIVGPQPEAVEAGAVVLKNGGNAVDAAIACALVQTVVDPQMCGVAGFGSMQLYFPSKNFHEFIDFHTTAPECVREDMWKDLIEGEARDGFGFFLKDRVNEVGYQSIMTPGSLKAYYEALSDYGSMDWKDVIQPAVDHAGRGFIVRPHVHQYWTKSNDFGRLASVEKLGFTESGKRIYFNEKGELWPPGSRVHNPDMARSLARIQKSGADLFYKGDMAEQIADDVEKHGGYLSLNDLKSYQTTRIDPLWGEYRGCRVATNQPPGGGVMILLMLHILENFDLSTMGHNSPEYIRTVAEAMKYATIDKDMRVGDPEFVDVPLDELLSKSYAADLARRIKFGEKADVKRINSGLKSQDTTHICVIDADGNAVTTTHSLGMPSGVITEGLGFMYNGCMSVFDPSPGRVGSISPGKRRFTGMSPTIVFKGDDPYIIIGAPGGTFITMGILQGILNVIDFNMTMFEAVSAPRFTANSNTIDVSNRIPCFITDELEKQGYPIARNYLSYAFSGVHGIRIKDGVLDGGADPGRDGMALLV